MLTMGWKGELRGGFRVRVIVWDRFKVRQLGNLEMLDFKTVGKLGS